MANQSRISGRFSKLSSFLRRALLVCALATLASPASAGPAPNLLDDNRGNTALQVGLSALFTTAANLGGLTVDPLVLAPPIIGVPARVIPNPAIHNLYMVHDWNGSNPAEMPTSGQIDTATARIASSIYFDSAAQYGIGGASFTGSHDKSIFCDLADPLPFAEFVQITHWVGCMVSFDRPSPLPGFFPPFTGVPKADNNSLYVVYLPRDKEIIDGSCDAPAYHFYTAVPDSHFEFSIFPPFIIPVIEARAVPFAVITTNCGTVPTLDELFETSSHEMIEAATDPFVGTGWLNDSVISSGPSLDASFFSDMIDLFNSIELDLKVGEAADICDENGTLTDPPADQHPTQPVSLLVDSTGLGQDHIVVSPYWSNVDDACVPFPPPVAVCRDISLDANAACNAGPITPAQIDNGSTVSQGSPMLSLDNPGPFPLGATTVTLTVTDSVGRTDTCTATVTVVDVTPPVLTVPANVSTSFCNASQVVSVGQATATDNCATALVPTGTVIAKNGGTLATPIPIIGGQVTLGVGSWTIQWTVSDGPNTTTALQTVVVGSTIQTSESFVLEDRAEVRNAAGGFAAVLNSGTGLTRVGNDGRAGGIQSVGPVSVLHRAVVGDIQSSGAITVDTDATTGTRSPFVAVALPALPSLPTFPAPGISFTLNSGTQNRAPGSYGSATVNGGTLVLASGDYFFQSLTINAGVTVRATPTTRIFVRNSLIFQSSILAASGAAVQPVFLGYAGTDNVSMLARFDGTLVAPNATVLFGTGSGLVFTGSFYVRTIRVQPASALVCLAGAALPPSPPAAPTCADGVSNGNETGVDCGGPVCGDCPNGSPCVTNGDCQSNVCTGLVCVSPGVNISATLSVSTDFGSGYCATLLVSNNGSTPVTSWNVSLNLGAATTYTTWNGTFSGTTGTVSVTPAFSWNQAIAPGTTNDSVGFCVNRSSGSTSGIATIVGASGT